MKTLITGSTGLLGSEIVKAYQDRQMDFYYLKDGSVYKGFTKVDESNIVFDKIIHCAGNSSQVYDENNPNKIFEDNVNLVQKIILRFAKRQCPIFIFPSSIVVYGHGGGVEDRVPSPTTFYGISKLTAEKVINYYTQQKLIKGFNFRLSALCSIEAKKGAVAHIINKLLNPELPVLELYGAYPGTNKPYTYAGDVARFFRNFVGNQGYQPVYPAYNLCVNDNITIDEIAYIAMHKLNIFKEVKFLGDEKLYPGDNKYLLADSSLAKREFKWNPQFDTSERVINYVCNMSKP